MKTKKVVVGAIAATMLSLSVCPIAPAAAAGETVQISVSKAEAEAGKQFTVDVSLADIPSTGIATLDFAIEFDNKVITIDEVKVGASAKTGADSADSTGEVPVFDSAVYNDEGFVELLWTTGLDDSSYYMKKDGVFCTITGTVASTAAEGKVADLKVVPSKRNLNPDSSDKLTSISCGYFNGDEKVSYTVKANDGSVTVGSEDKFPRGDANCSGEVKWRDDIALVKAWRDFITRDCIYLLRSQKGDVWVVNIIENPTTSYEEKYRPISTSVSFTWAECASVDDIMVVSGNVW